MTRIGITKDYEVYQKQNQIPNMAKDYNDWADKIIDHNDYFEVPTLARLKGWENGGTWHSGDYFPPQFDPNWVLFDDAVEKAKRSSAWPWLFINAKAVRRDSKTWYEATAQSAAMLDVNGQPIEEHVEENGVDVVYMIMCMESEGWILQLTKWILTLAQHKVDIVQLDCFPLNELRDCYSVDHLHGIPGCGTRPYRIAENMLVLRSQLRGIYPNFGLSSEYGAELYLPSFDMHHSRECWAEANEKGGWVFRQGLAESIPLFQFVYHSNIIFLDMYNLGPWAGASPADSSYDKLAVGRAFVWGGICCYNMQDDIEKYKSLPSFSLLKKCAQARVGFLRDFLVFGRMLTPPKVEGPMMKVEVKYHYTDGPNDPLLFSGDVPSILTSAWQSERGDVAVIVLNIGDDANDVNVPLAPYSQYIRPGTWMYTYDDCNFVTCRPVEGDLGQETYKLEPLHFVAFVFASYPGDLSADGDVDFEDMAVLASSWRTSQGHPAYNPACDISDPNDSIIDEQDLAVFVEAWLAGKE